MPPPCLVKIGQKKMAAKYSGLYFMFLAPPPSEVSGSATEDALVAVTILFKLVCFEVQTSCLQWEQAVMLSWEGEEGPGSFCDYASRAVEKEFRDNKLHINSWLKADSGSTSEDIELWLDIFKSRGRS